MLGADAGRTDVRTCGSCRRDLLVPFPDALAYFSLAPILRAELHRKNVARCSDCGDYLHFACNASLNSDEIRCSECAADHTRKMDSNGVLYGLALLALVVVAVLIIANLPPAAFGASR